MVTTAMFCEMVRTIGGDILTRVFASTFIDCLKQMQCYDVSSEIVVKLRLRWSVSNVGRVRQSRQQSAMQWLHPKWKM